MGRAMPERALLKILESYPSNPHDCSYFALNDLSVFRRISADLLHLVPRRLGEPQQFSAYYPQVFRQFYSKFGLFEDGGLVN